MIASARGLAALLSGVKRFSEEIPIGFKANGMGSSSSLDLLLNLNFIALRAIV
jgi:hypothetical protein